MLLTSELQNYWRRKYYYSHFKCFKLWSFYRSSQTW